jgi:tRNA U34 2-thiouridine synthase MnmA/TrmU
MQRAVALLSGGIDSSTATAIARHQGYEVYAISFDYGQRHRCELEAALTDDLAPLDRPLDEISTSIPTGQATDRHSG